MRRRSALIAAAALAALALAAGVARAQASPDVLAAVEKEQKDLFARIAPAVVYISTPSGIGTGFLIGNTSWVLTNAHVVGDHKAVDVLFHDGKKRRGTIRARGPDKLDLVLLDVGQVDKTKARGLFLSVDRLEVGDWVASVGHGMGGTWTFTAGMVSNIYPVRDGKKRRAVFQTQIPLNPGNSGGPIFNRHGVVVGVATAGIVEANNINFAIRSDMVLDAFPLLAGAACACIEILAGKGVPVFMDGTMIGKGPRIKAPARPGARHEVFVLKNGAMRKRVITFPGTAAVDLR